MCLCQISVLWHLPFCRGLCCTTRHDWCGWQASLHQCVRDGDVPSHTPVIFPWYSCHAVGSFFHRILINRSHQTPQTVPWRKECLVSQVHVRASRSNWWPADWGVPPLHEYCHDPCGTRTRLTMWPLMCSVWRHCYTESARPLWVTSIVLNWIFLA